MKAYKSKQQKVCIVYFGSLSRNPSKLHLWFGNEIIAKFANEGVLYKIICLEGDGLGINPALLKAFTGTFLSRVAYLMSLFTDIFYSQWSRKIYEYLFGVFVLINVDFNKVDKFFFLRATNKEIAILAKKKNKKVFGMISIFPRSLIYQKIKLQELKWQIREKSDYTNKYRIKEYDKIICNWDVLIPWTNTSVVKGLLRKCNLIPNLKFTNVEHGINNELFFYKEMPSLEQLNYLVVTDSTLKKGLLELLEVWPTFVSRSHEKVSLTIVGNLGKEITGAVKKMEGLSNITFTGYVNDVHNYIEKSHVFVCPSIIDMGPRTIKQAMRIGRIVIASDLCGHSGCIENFKDGLVYNANNLSTLLDRLIWTVNNKEKLNEIGRTANLKSISFDDNKFADEIFDIVYFS